METARLDKVASRQGGYLAKDVTVTVLVVVGLVAGLVALLLT